ncbi:MAG: xanthine dehydrogenase family protein molybdopterin-binding subunit [Clostridiales bacterium]
MGGTIGLNIKRKEAWAKVTGQAKYTDDFPTVGHYTARLLTSPYAHARIISIDKTDALSIKGVKAIITGEDYPNFCGPLLLDRPAIANQIARYAGEPVAMAIAVDEATAALAAAAVKVEYEVLPAVFTPQEALKPAAPLVHENIGKYGHTAEDINPRPNSNISSYFPVRKGNMTEGWSNSQVTIEQEFFLPPSDHLAMEVRAARAEISKDGMVTITTSSQAPFEVRKQIAECFQVPAGNIRVLVPFVGGGFGGKAPVMQELLAYIASREVAGKPVRLVMDRKEDLTAAPSRAGLSARIKLGATKEGLLQAAELTFWLDNGAYTDIGPYMVKAIAADCTGPYRVDNLHCDAYGVYTNHTYATSCRSFSHESLTFCIERAMDLLAEKLAMDPLKLRMVNAITAGQYTPTQVLGTFSNLGNLPACISRLQEMTDWQEGPPVQITADTVRAKGMACFWKAATPPTNAPSGALITFNPDGSLNLNTGVVEMGSASQSHLAQMLADKLGISDDQVHVVLEVDTRLNPVHYKTVASITSYIAGRAVMRAAEDILAQLRKMGAEALSCFPEDIEIKQSRVYARQNPGIYIEFKDIVMGYKDVFGNSIGEPVVGRGTSMFKGLSNLNPKTGKGQSGPAWTVGAQAVEVEMDLRDYTYRIIRAYSVMDVGNLINPEGMSGSVRGGMSMGISMASRENFSYAKNGRGEMTTPSLRSYKALHIGEEPIYELDFVETPQLDAPYGMRSMSEHGIIGMPAALANALSKACGVAFNQLPLKPEDLWRTATGAGAVAEPMRAPGAAAAVAAAGDAAVGAEASAAAFGEGAGFAEGGGIQ